MTLPSLLETVRGASLLRPCICEWAGSTQGPPRPSEQTQAHGSTPYSANYTRYSYSTPISKHQTFLELLVETQQFLVFYLLHSAAHKELSPEHMLRSDKQLVDWCETTRWNILGVFRTPLSCNASEVQYFMHLHCYEFYNYWKNFFDVCS